MQLTKQQLKTIIKEELTAVLTEFETDELSGPTRFPGEGGGEDELSGPTRAPETAKKIKYLLGIANKSVDDVRW